MDTTQSKKVGAINPILPVIIIVIVLVAAAVVFMMKKGGTPEQTMTPTNTSQSTEPSPQISSSPPAGSTKIVPTQTTANNQSVDEVNASIDTQLNAMDTDAKGIDQGLQETPADLSSN